MPKTHTTRVSRASGLGDRIPVGQSCLVVIYGPGLGRRYELGDGEFTIGREVGSTIHVDLDNVSRRHAKLLWRDGKVCIKDLGSTNGTYLNNEEIGRRAEVPLRSGDLLKIGSGIFKFLYGGDVESLFHEEIYRITIMDGLTQIYNKRYFMEFLEREMARGLRYGRPLSLMMIDVDHFKEVNDRHGHLAGDAVLRELASKVKSKVRREECLARFGGEEFRAGHSRERARESAQVRREDPCHGGGAEVHVRWQARLGDRFHRHRRHGPRIHRTRALHPQCRRGAAYICGEGAGSKSRGGLAGH